MRFCLRAVPHLILLIGLAFLAPVRAETPVEAPKAEVPKADAGKKPSTAFLRLQRGNKKEPVALETAIVHYVPAEGEKGVAVDLVAVVHVGDKDYYQKLNKQFEKYDVVLFELVAPQGTQIPKGGKNSDNPVAMIQQMAKRMLDLELQLEQVDYTKKNFVHADLSPDEMAKTIKDRGDDGLTITLRIVADLMQRQNVQNMKRENEAANPPAEIDIFDLLLDPQRGVKLKRMMAEQFEQLDDPNGGFGKTINQILITDRNKAALKVMQQQMAKGKKKIAIFYGAAHMPDFEKRLKADFDLKRQGEEWLQAWDLHGK